MPTAVPERELHERVRQDFESRAARPATVEPPTRAPDGSWRSPGGAPITWTGVLSSTRPPQNEGAPLTAYYCAAEQRYWVHQPSVLGSTEFWYGPFELR